MRNRTSNEKKREAVEENRRAKDKLGIELKWRGEEWRGKGIERTGQATDAEGIE